MKKSLPKSARLCLAAFFCPVLLYMLVMAVNRIVPFGPNTLVFWDANGQYSAFLTAWRKVLCGGGELWYSLSRTLGSGMIGIWAYYTASPLNLLLVLFPDAQLPLAFTVLVLVKMGLAGLTFQFYAQQVHHAGWKGLPFAVTYALMGFVAVYFWDIMWMDAVFLLPLIVLGIRRLIQPKPSFLYLLALALGLFCNYYIGFMLCLFSVLYLIYLLLRPQNRAALGRTLGRFALSSLLAGGLSACLLVPAYLALTKGYGIALDQLLSVTRQASVLDLATKLYTGSVSFDQLRYGLPNLYIGIPALLLTGVYFIHPAIDRRRRMCTLCLLGVFLLSFLLRPLYLLWHGMDIPNCMPARFSFLCSFVMIDAALQGFLALWEHPGVLPPRRMAVLAGGFFALSCILFRDELPPYLAYETMILDVVLFLAACMLAQGLSNLPKRRLLCAALFLIQAGGLMLNAHLALHRMEYVDQVKADQYAEASRTTRAMVDRVQAADTGLYRMEKNFIHSENDPLMYGYAGLSHYSSDLSGELSIFLDRLGINQSYYRVTYSSGTTPVLNSFLGIRYVLWQQGMSFAEAPSGFQAQWTEGDYTLYQNPYALSLATLVPAAQTADPIATEDPFVNQNALVSDLTGRDVTLFTPYTDYSVQEEDGWLDFSFTVPAGMELYLQTTGVYVDWNEGGMEDNTRVQGCVPLPVSEQEESYRLRVMQQEDVPAVYQVYQYHPEAFRQTYELLSPNICTAENPGDGYLVIQANVTEASSQLLLTMPYDEGWKAWVDGTPCRIRTRYGVLMAFDLSQGQHTIELRYTPVGLTVGLLLSGLSLAAVLAWFLLTRRKKTAH